MIASLDATSLQLLALRVFFYILWLIYLIFFFPALSPSVSLDPKRPICASFTLVLFLIVRFHAFNASLDSLRFLIVLAVTPRFIFFSL